MLDMAMLKTSTTRDGLKRFSAWVAATAAYSQLNASKLAWLQEPVVAGTGQLQPRTDRSE
jgi:hypothetical protein